jgi:hypothetical protein
VSGGTAADDSSGSGCDYQSGVGSHIGKSETVSLRQQVGSYLGLIPAEDSSGRRQRLGHISKQGNTLLRFLLVEAAHVMVRIEPEVAQSIFSSRHAPWSYRGQRSHGAQTGREFVLDVAQRPENQQACALGAHVGKA